MGPLIQRPPAGVFSGAASGFDVPVAPGPGDARELLIRELAKQQYQDAKPGLLQEALNRFLQWVGDLVSSLQALDPNTGTLVVGLAVLLLAAVAIWVVKPRLDRRRRTEAEVFDAGTARTAAAHRQMAEAAAAGGDWNTAVTEQFRALVRAMEERAVLEEQPGRTADEVSARLVPAFPRHTGPLRQAAALFDAVRYGNRPAGPDGYQLVRGLDAALAAQSPAAGGRPEAAVPQ